MIIYNDHTYANETHRFNIKNKTYTRDTAITLNKFINFLLNMRNNVRNNVGELVVFINDKGELQIHNRSDNSNFYRIPLKINEKINMVSVEEVISIDTPENIIEEAVLESDNVISEKVVDKTDKSKFEVDDLFDSPVEPEETTVVKGKGNRIKIQK